MTATRLFRAAVAQGLQQAGLKRESRQWVSEEGPIKWVARVVGRAWAGPSVEASLVITVVSGEEGELLAQIVLEALPQARSLEVMQALDLSSNLPDEVRHDRIVAVATEFGLLLRSMSSFEELRRSKSGGALRFGWVSPSFSEVVGEP